jgi:hypothetical protein
MLKQSTLPNPLDAQSTATARKKRGGSQPQAIAVQWMPGALGLGVSPISTRLWRGPASRFYRFASK